jgi:hypothetical protein
MSAQTNPAVELARYRISAGERVLKGQRVLGVDIPADGHGRRFLVERELTSNDELAAIVADYLQQAACHDVVPAGRNPLDNPEPDR